jgi:hypothetical protein
MSLKSIFSSVLIVFFFAGCDEKDTIAPTFISGEIKGTFADGTPLNESFRFEQLSGDIEKFEELTTGQKLRLVRSDGASYMALGLILKDAGLPSEKLDFWDIDDYSPSEFDFFLRKEESPTSVVEITCKGFRSGPAFRSMSIEANKTYNLVVDERHHPVIVSHVREYVKSPMGGEPWYVSYLQFKNTKGDVIHFSGREGYRVPYPFQKIDYADGSSSTTDQLYQDLVYAAERLTCCPETEFMRKTPDGNISLSEEYRFSDGEGLITSHTYDQSTGRLTFDFQISLPGSAGHNSTGHDVTIEGKFDSGSGKIYLTTKN